MTLKASLSITLFLEANEERDRRLEQMNCRLDQSENMYQSYKASSSFLGGEIRIQSLQGKNDIFIL